MTEWGVVLVVAALLAMGASIGAPLWKLGQVIAKFEVKIDTLQVEHDDCWHSNRDEHKEFTEELGGHETRITVLEQK